MLAIILKDLHCYTNSCKHRRIPFITLSISTLVLLIATLELYAHHREAGSIEIGKHAYTHLIIALSILQLLVPRHTVEAIDMEHRYLRADKQNGALLALTPLANWKIIAGKLISVAIWAMWSTLHTVPLFALSNYIGGSAPLQWVKCGIVLTVSNLFFALIGIRTALSFSTPRAKTISYGCVLLITLFPLIPTSLLKAVPILAAISPLCALLSILKTDPTHLWVWNIGLFSLLSVLLFPIFTKPSPSHVDRKPNKKTGPTLWRP